MSEQLKSMQLRQERSELTMVSHDPRELISDDTRRILRENLERMARQHNAAESSTAHYLLH